MLVSVQLPVTSALGHMIHSSALHTWHPYIHINMGEAKFQGHPHKTRYTETRRRESGEEPQTHGHRGNLPEQNTNSLCSKIKNWQRDLIKLQSFCNAKGTVNRTKRQSTDLGKIFTNPIFNRGQISNINKELKKLDSRESNNCIKKWETELNKEFSTEETQMVERHLKKCSTSLVIREMLIKMTTSHLSEWLRSKTQVTADAGKDV
jgi:hypothetical protein